jgi:hypothetical protein
MKPASLSMTYGLRHDSSLNLKKSHLRKQPVTKRNMQSALVLLYNCYGEPGLDPLFSIGDDGSPSYDTVVMNYNDALQTTWTNFLKNRIGFKKPGKAKC